MVGKTDLTAASLLLAGLLPRAVLFRRPGVSTQEFELLVCYFRNLRLLSLFADVDWTRFKCVKSCDEGDGPSCGGLHKSWNVLHSSKGDCCGEHLWWLGRGDCTAR